MQLAYLQNIEIDRLVCMHFYPIRNFFSLNPSWRHDIGLHAQPLAPTVGSSNYHYHGHIPDTQ